MVIFLVVGEMVRQLLDAGSKQGDQDFRRTGIGRTALGGRNDGAGFGGIQRNSLS